MRKKLLVIALGCSLLVNLALALLLMSSWFNSPSDRLGRLTSDVAVGEFGGSTVLFRLPAGLTVRDSSPRGFAAIGQFEPYRFSVVVTTDREHLVDYSIAPAGLHPHGDHYSVELQAAESGR